RIHYPLLVFAIDIAPPCLSMPDELRLRKFFRHLVKPLNAHIESGVLEVQQHRDLMLARDLKDLLHGPGVALKSVFLLANAEGSGREKPLELGARIRTARHGVREENVLGGILPAQIQSGLIAAHPWRESRPGSYRKQHRLLHAHRALVQNKLLRIA